MHTLSRGVHCARLPPPLTWRLQHSRSYLQLTYIRALPLVMHMSAHSHLHIHICAHAHCMPTSRCNISSEPRQHRGVRSCGTCGRASPLSSSQSACDTLHGISGLLPHRSFLSPTFTNPFPCVLPCFLPSPVAIAGASPPHKQALEAMSLPDLAPMPKLIHHAPVAGRCRIRCCAGTPRTPPSS